MLNGLFFEIQTETRFPINFNWEISVAWVHTLQYNSVLYNITGLNGLFFEIQTETRFPINFNCEISVAWVCTLHEQNLSWGKRSGFFSRNSKVRLPQTDAI